MAIDESPLRRRTEAAAVQETFELLPQAVCVLEGPRRRIVASNAAHRRMVGRSEIVGELATEIFSAVVGQRLFEMLDQAYSSERRTPSASGASGWSTTRDGPSRSSWTATCSLG